MFREKVVRDSYCIISVTLIFRICLNLEREAILYGGKRKMGYEVIQLLTEEDFVREI